MTIKLEHLAGNWEYCGWDCRFTGISSGGIAIYVANKDGFAQLGATTPEYLETSIHFMEYSYDTTPSEAASSLQSDGAQNPKGAR